MFDELDGESQMLRSDEYTAGTLLSHVCRLERAERCDDAPVTTRAAQLVQVAEETGGENRRGSCVELLGCSALHQAPLVEDHDAISDAKCLIWLVGHDDRGGSCLAQKIEGLLSNLIAKPTVEARERLVHQQHMRVLAPGRAPTRRADVRPPRACADSFARSA